MKTVVISIVGLNCSGIVYMIASNLAVLGCDIQEATQTILRNQFAAIFVVSQPANFDNIAMQNALTKAAYGQGMQLSVSISDFVEGAVLSEASEPFVVTVQGPDRREIIASITKVFTEHTVSIETLKAIHLPQQEQSVLLVFEVALPTHINFLVFRKTLVDKAAQLGLVLSMQHRDIFEAMHRVTPV